MKKIILIIAAILILGSSFFFIYWLSVAPKTSVSSNPSLGATIKTNQIVEIIFSSEEEAAKAKIYHIIAVPGKGPENSYSISKVKNKAILKPKSGFWIAGSSITFIVKLNGGDYNFKFNVEKKKDIQMSAEENNVYEEMMKKDEEERKAKELSTPLHEYIPIRGVSGSAEYLIDRDIDNSSNLLISITGDYRAYNSGDKDTYYKSIDEGKAGAKDKIRSLGEDPDKLEKEGRIKWETH